MKLTPDQIEEQRPIFLAEWAKDYHGNPIDENGCFWRKDAEECFRYWIKALESQPKWEIEINKLNREIKYWRCYGNKDCTAMADAAMESGELDEH